MTKIAAIQMSSTASVGNNLVQVELMVRKAAKEGVKCVVLPQHFACIPKDPKDIVLVREALGSGRIQRFIAELARQHRIWIVAGSQPISCSDEALITNTCLVYDQDGNCVARYDKQHLFDTYLGDLEQYEESSYSQVGGEALTVVKTPFGNIGLAVGFDLRFPEHFVALREAGAQIITVAAKFPRCLGDKQWHPLVTARAIDNQCYVIAANQYGRHESHWQTYGHSMIVEPWGSVLNQCVDGTTCVMSDIDLERLNFLRDEFAQYRQ